jgi:hypothetical protein
MDLKELKDLLLKRLHIELQLFKDSILRQPKEEIYKSSYKIEVFVNSYEILLEDMERLDGDTVRGLLYQNFGILDFLYQEWLTREDCIFDELKAYISGELGMIAKINSPACGKEGADGTELDKAA